MSASIELRSLRDRPFELLKELERRSRGTQGGEQVATGTGDWVGVAVRTGTELVLVPREEVREVLEHPAATRVPGACNWIRGITNVRGRLIPVVDMLAFSGNGETSQGRSSRLIVVNHPDIPAGILVDEVMGFRRFAASEFETQPADTPGELDEYLLGHCRRGQEVWPVLSLVRLVESARFADVAA